MKNFYICSDIHNFFTEMMTALKEKEFDIKNKEHILIICGDLFDRGNQAVECYKFVKKLNKQKRLIYIKGNHEDLLFDCVKELKEYGGCASSHHYSNGTVDTCVQFMKKEILEEVLEFIEKNTVDYYELGKYIFVHSYIPTYNDKKEVYYTQNINYKYNPNWRNVNKEEWESARWGNPFEIYKQGICEPNKIIVSGHWHCSAGNKIKEIVKNEFPNKEDEEFKIAFTPAVFDNFIGIDTCTAYSGKVNVLVLSEDEIG